MKKLVFGFVFFLFIKETTILLIFQDENLVNDRMMSLLKKWALPYQYNLPLNTPEQDSTYIYLAY